LLEDIKKIVKITTLKDKQYISLLIIMSIVLSIIETIGVSAIMPFISLASNPNIVSSNKYYEYFFNLFSMDSTTDFVILFGFSLVCFFIVRAIYTTFYYFMLNRFVFGRYYHYAFRLFLVYTKMPYANFVNKNSGVLTKTIIQEAQNVTIYIQQFMLALAEVFTILLLYSLLIYINWKMTLVMTVVLFVKVLLITKTISKVIKRQGVKRTKLQADFYKIINSTFGNIKLIKMKQNFEPIYKEFSDASYGYARTNIINNTLAELPRAFLETVGFSVLILAVVYILFRYENADFVIPIISMYALALYRMLPAINRIVNSYNSMMFHSKSLDIVYQDMHESEEYHGSNEVGFCRNIKLKNISFSYDGKKNVLSNINLTIEKNQKVAFVGESGGGKSTLVDVIAGIYRAQSGDIYIDDVLLDDDNLCAWRKKIGYIPQSIYLFDGTIRENVAFGDEIDDAKIIRCLKQANMWDFLETKEGLDTMVGDGGLKLSGGQKQRVGIARALYGDPEVLILDEATSALDNDTEEKIMDEIYEISTNKTLIIIAHRLSTVERCEVVFKVRNGKINI